MSKLAWVVVASSYFQRDSNHSENQLECVILVTIQDRRHIGSSDLIFACDLYLAAISSNSSFSTQDAEAQLKAMLFGGSRDSASSSGTASPASLPASKYLTCISSFSISMEKVKLLNIPSQVVLSQDRFEVYEQNTPKVQIFD